MGDFSECIKEKFESNIKGQTWKSTLNVMINVMNHMVQFIRKIVCQYQSAIAYGTRKIFTLEYLMEEMKQCRVSCRYCHRIRTAEQTSKRYEELREQKRNRFN